MHRIDEFKKGFEQPDEVRDLPRARIEVIHLKDHTAMRVTFQPGWRWSLHVKPTAKTELCEVAHVGYLISGQLATRFPDGTEIISKGGDFVDFPAGHDGWVVGDEPVVFLDFIGGEQYGRELRKAA
jgi:hypothetical protein